jgi:hypothetical protein
MKGSEEGPFLVYFIIFYALKWNLSLLPFFCFPPTGGQNTNLATSSRKKESYKWMDRIQKIEFSKCFWLTKTGFDQPGIQRLW